MMRLGLIALIIGLLIGAGYKTYAAIDQSAYERAQLHFTTGLAAIKDKAAKDAVQDWRAAQAIAGDETDVEIRIVEKIRIVEREVPKIIEKIVLLKPECAVLPELGRLFSDQAAASNHRSPSIAEDPG